jgi:hypothetical protein
MDNQLAAIDEKWAALAQRVEPLRIAAEKTDIQVDEIALLWVPMG